MKLKHVVLLLFVFSVRSFAQISPGELTSAHSKLEGLSNCTKCHILGGHVDNSKCLDCHTEIKRSIAANQGYHSSGNIRGKNCWACHSEHHGRDFKILKFEKKNFDHKLTGFELTGKHSSTECQKCHQPKNITDASLKKRNGTFIGLNTSCISCHVDYHQKTLSDKCQNCHNTTSYKPAVYFKHDLAKFKLTGAHVSLNCEKCHVKESRNGQAFQRFTGLSFSNCTPCHKDIHEGKFGRDCQKCHSTSSFKNINKLAFDHNKTNFPLLGKHRNVNCQECHKKNDYKVKLTFNKCSNCHSDFHKGEFAANKVRKDCKDCHSVDAFTPSLFTIDDHNQLKFALSGSHLAITCQSCHYKDKTWRFRLDGAKCINCHNNVHGNELTAKFLPDNKCESCHNVDTWKIKSYDHNLTGFELKGKHAALGCRSCHYDQKDMQFRFASTKSSCETCHRDIHFGQFKTNTFTECDCGRCHTINDWKPLNFNHEATKFSLKGAHQNVSCVSCHPVVELAGVKYNKYKVTDFKCSSCHKA